MGLDQFIAVFWPFKHARLQRYLNRAMLTIGIIVGIILAFLISTFDIFSYSKVIYDPLFAMIMTICLTVLLIVYPTTAYKLYRQSVRIRPQTQTPLGTLNKPQQGKSENPELKRTSSGADATPLHVRALMIYVAVLIQMLVAISLSAIGILLIGKQWMVYFIYLNHIGNPVIYYCFVPKFRKAAKERARMVFYR